MTMREDELSRDETARLIGSDKVEGTSVYGPDSERIGSIERVMIDKRTGQASYAVLAFGGFLGIGEKRHPVPWDQMRYDVNLDGYVVGVTRDSLEGAPSYEPGVEPDWSDEAWTGGVREHYSRGRTINPGVGI